MANTRKVFAASTTMSKHMEVSMLTSHVLSWGWFLSEDEARGHFTKKAMESKPGFSVDDILITELQLPGMSADAQDSLTVADIAASVFSSGGTMRNLVQSLGVKLSKANPQFDAGAFYTRCGYPPGGISPHEVEL